MSAFLSSRLVEPGRDMKLYYSPGACSLAPHILLEELGVPFEAVRTPISEGATRSPEFLALNPQARVPVLEVGGEIYTEAPALLLFLTTSDAEQRFLPRASAAELARCLEWIAWLATSLHIAYAQLWRPERFLPAEVDPEPLKAQGAQTIRTFNAAIESRLCGPWVLGPAYSVADMYLLPFYRWGGRIGLPMKELYPRWSAWADRMLSRPAVQRAAAREEIEF
jgi:glutathione S-transferase